MKINTSARAESEPLTHQGAPAVAFAPLDELKRAVMCCMLWEDNFYESGQTIANRIGDLVKRCDPYDVAALAVYAREKHHLRHVPLLLVRELARTPSRCPHYLVRDTLYNVIQRPDEITEFLAIYWKDGKTPLAKQVKLGLAMAFAKFDEYQLAKWDRKDAKIRLRDVMFLTHPAVCRTPRVPGDVNYVEIAPAVDRPKYKRSVVARDSDSLLKKLADDTLATPDTWETQLSAGADKKATFERLLAEKKLGYMALLRNLRNMREAGVDGNIVAKALADGNKQRILPFRFVAAQRAVPNWIDGSLSYGMVMSLHAMERIPGRTAVLIDVSGSMDVKLSEKSDLTRADAAACVGVMVASLCDECGVFTFSDRVVQVQHQQSDSPFHLIDMIKASQPHGNTYLGKAVEQLKRSLPGVDRLIVITDEQSHDKVGGPPNGCKGYMVNVASHERGVGHGDWLRINGWSEGVVSFIQALEA